MKKIIAVSIATLYLICTALTAFAAPTTEPARYVKDSANDVINVSGRIDATEFVTLVVLNPGKTESDINFADSSAMADAVQYMSSYWAEGGSYSFDVPMYGESGGVFTILVTAGGVKTSPVTIEFYYAGEKKSIIADINDETDFNTLKGLVDDAYVLYSLGDDKLYVDGDLTEIAKNIELTRDNDGDFDEDDVSAFSAALKNSGIVGAYNAGLDNVVIVDGVPDYTSAEYLALDGTDELNDFLALISEDGREDLIEDLVLNGEEYETLADISAKFRELVAYYGIIANDDAGYGHVDHYLDTYADVYEDAGFKLNKLRDNEKNKVYKSLVKSKTKNLNDLKKAFNALVTGETENGGGSSSTGGSSFSPSTPVTSPADTNYITPSKFFVDLESVQWAEESIIALANRGIVSGKGNNNFAPGDYVTRAEFLKMLMGALDMNTSGAGINFTDIPADHWAAPYVAAAVNNGIANGLTATEFAPDGFVTREMAATFSARAMEKAGADLVADSSTFADEAYVSDWAKTSVSALKSAGILTGSGDNMFNPKDNLTRAQAAKIIYGIMSSMGLVEIAE